jgi:hypothetical protein
MPDTMLRPPLLLMILAAGLWTFWLALKFPDQIPRTLVARLRAAILEGVACAFLWTGVNTLVELELTAQVVSNGLVSGLVWTGTAFYSKVRYL